MAFKPDLPVVTERLLLRALTPDDGPQLLTYHQLPEVHRYLLSPPMDLAAVDRQLDGGRWSRTSIDGDDQAIFLGVELRASGALVGDVMLAWRSAEHRQAEIGYVFDPAHHGNGYATEAGRALLGLAFEGLDAHRVTASLDARNNASAGVLERLGMRREGHLVENMFVFDEWTDELVYGLLRHEWAG